MLCVSGRGSLSRTHEPSRSRNRAPVSTFWKGNERRIGLVDLQPMPGSLRPGNDRRRYQAPHLPARALSSHWGVDGSIQGSPFVFRVRHTRQVVWGQISTTMIRTGSVGLKSTDDDSHRVAHFRSCVDHSRRRSPGLLRVFLLVAVFWFIAGSPRATWPRQSFPVLASVVNSACRFGGHGSFNEPMRRCFLG